jgi:hypothetical protein
LSWYGSSSLQEPPIIRIQRVPTRVGSPEENNNSPKGKSPTHLLTSANLSRSPTPNSVKALKKKPKEVEEVPPVKDKHEEKKPDEEEEVEDEFVKRRGKKRRKKRDESRGPPAFQTSLDPETQVIT